MQLSWSRVIGSCHDWTNHDSDKVELDIAGAMGSRNLLGSEAPGTLHAVCASVGISGARSSFADYA